MTRERRTKRARLRAILVVVMVAVVATACQPPPPPPPGQVAPVIESIVVSPAPVNVGEPMTVVVVASDDGPTSDLTFEYTILAGPFNAAGYPGPGYTTLEPAAAGCGSATVEQISGNRVSVTRACTIPMGSPAGEWRSSVTVSDGLPNGSTGRVYVFDVVRP